MLAHLAEMGRKWGQAGIQSLGRPSSTQDLWCGAQCDQQVALRAPVIPGGRARHPQQPPGIRELVWEPPVLLFTIGQWVTQSLSGPVSLSAK